MAVRTGLSRLSVVGWVMLGCVSGCDTKHASAPTPVASSLAVTCNATTLGSLGQQGNCSARLTLSDSRTLDQTVSAQWTSSDPASVSVSSGGIITAVAPGNADISAVVQGLAARQSVAVRVACAFSIAPLTAAFPSSGGTAVVTVAATPAGCSPATWTASASDEGLAFSPATGEGDGPLMLTAASNSGPAVTRSATIAGQTLIVNLAAAPPPPPATRTLHLTLVQGENLSGPWAGTVAGPDGYSCSLAQHQQQVSCAPLVVKNGSALELVVTLDPRIAHLGRPIGHTIGCDTRRGNDVCGIVMNSDRTVTVGIGCDVSCGR